MSDTTLCIVGHGAVGASGLCSSALGAAVWSRHTPFRLAPKQAFGLGEVVRVSSCPLFDDATPPEKRLAALLSAAIAEAVPADWGFPGRVEVSLALPPWAHGPHFLRQIGSILTQTGHGFATQAPTCTLGHTAAGLQALDVIAKNLLDVSKGAARSDFALWVGADTAIDPHLLRAFKASGLLSTEHAPDGMIPGEAAAALLLTRMEVARKYQLKILGHLHVPTLAFMSESQTRTSILSTVLSETLKSTSDTQAIATLLCDAAFLPWRIEALAEALLVCQKSTHASQLMFTSQHLGELGAAFAPLSVIVALHGNAQGLTSGMGAVVCCCDDTLSGAVRINAPWQPSIFLRDTPPLLREEAL